MTIPAAFLDELRARVGLAGVVGRRVKLVRAGRELKGCCPFHNERTPSFYVNEDKGFYHCFGCGAHGDVIRFVVEQEGLGFREAVESLAAQAGLSLPEETPRERERAKAAAGLHEIAGEAADWFCAQLASEGGAAARAYLKRRGVSAETAAAFALGFAPDSRAALRTALGRHGDPRLIEAGLLVQPDGEAAPYDRFRGRLMFPIRDPRGRVVGFGGRALGDAQPKYLNSAEGPLFEKGRLLYNLDRAAPEARKSGRLLVVEGYMDVIGLARAGIVEAVAPLGTALTEAQLELLWRVAPEPLLAFDGDAAGQRAGMRAALRALPLLKPGRSLRFVTLPMGQDPDDLVREGGAAAMNPLIDAAEPLIDRLWRSETEGVDAATPERRAGIRARLRAHIATIEEGGVRALYRAEIDGRFDAQWAVRPARRFEQRGPPTPARASAALLASSARDAADGELAAALLGLCEHPWLADRFGEQVAQLVCGAAAMARLRGNVLGALAQAPDLDKAGLAHDLERSGHGPQLAALRSTQRLTFSFLRAGDAVAAERDFGAFLGHALSRQRLEAALGAATRRLGETGADDAFAAQTALIAERRRAEAELTGLAERLRSAADTS